MGFYFLQAEKGAPQTFRGSGRRRPPLGSAPVPMYTIDRRVFINHYVYIYCNVVKGKSPKGPTKNNYLFTKLIGLFRDKCFNL